MQNEKSPLTTEVSGLSRWSGVRISQSIMACQKHSLLPCSVSRGIQQHIHPLQQQQKCVEGSKCIKFDRVRLRVPSINVEYAVFRAESSCRKVDDVGALDNGGNNEAALRVRTVSVPHQNRRTEARWSTRQRGWRRRHRQGADNATGHTTYRSGRSAISIVCESAECIEVMKISSPRT